jgi:hypothetical protein
MKARRLPEKGAESMLGAEKETYGVIQGWHSCLTSVTAHLTLATHRAEAHTSMRVHDIRKAESRPTGTGSQKYYISTCCTYQEGKEGILKPSSTHLHIRVGVVHGLAMPAVGLRASKRHPPRTAPKAMPTNRSMRIARHQPRPLRGHRCRMHRLLVRPMRLHLPLRRHTIPHRIHRQLRRLCLPLSRHPTPHGIHMLLGRRVRRRLPLSPHRIPHMRRPISIRST